MRLILHLTKCTILWLSLLTYTHAQWPDCPRLQLDPQQGVNRLCQNTVAGANSVPLFQAISRLWLDHDLPQANQLIRQAYHDLFADAQRITPELADEKAKWQMRLWIRTHFLFNSRTGQFPGRLEPETERLMHELFWNYAFSKSTVDRAHPRYLWFIQGSENHDLMDLSNAFLALQAIQHLPEYKDRPLRDGNTATEHVHAWTKYYTAYADERVARGLLVECASSIYGKYAIPELVNMADFADDAVLRRKMTMLLDVLWADWSVEQLNGIRGGGKSRVYQGKYSRFGDRDAYAQMAAVLLGEGPWTKGKHSHTNSGFAYCLATTGYRLPQVVQSLVDPDQRGSYAYVSRRPAKMTGIDKLPDCNPHGCWYVFDPNNTRAVRYTYCTPDYVLGTWWVDPGLAESVIVKDGTHEWGNANYAALNSQNRWQGIIFRTGPNDRLYPQCLTSRRDKNSADVSVSNHQQIAVQHKNLMIAQANLARTDIQAMRVYVADSVRKQLVERNGWQMARIGNAYVAFQGIDPDTNTTSPGHWEQDNYYRLDNWRAPVLILAGATTRFDTLDQFAEYAAGLQRKLTDDKLILQFADSDEQAALLTFDLKQRSLPTVNGQQIDLNPPKVYNGPHLQSDFGTGLVTIRSHKDAYQWNMNDNTIRAQEE
jgi:hypothetical protein